MDAWQMIRKIGMGVLRRRKALVVLISITGVTLFVPAAYYYTKERPRFGTSATILLETRPDRVPLFQEFSPFRPLPVQLAILRSRSLGESVLERLPKSSVDDLIENPYYVDHVLELRNRYRRFMGVEPEVESPHRRALTELQQGRVRFSSDRNGIVELTAEASKPQVAIDIANTYIEALLARTRSFNIDDARVSREFLEQQVGDVRKALQGSEESLRAFTMGHGGIRVPEQSQATVTRLTQAETAFAEVAANRKMIEARLEGLREKMEAQKGSVPPPSAAPRAVPAEVQRLRQQLAQLEAALLDLRVKYTDEHPRVQLVQAQIAELQSALGGAVRETTSVIPAPGAVPPVERINFAEQVVALETSLHALSAQEEALRKQVTALRQSLSGLSRTEMEYARLVRDVESNRNLHTLLSDRLTGARIREQGEMKVVKVIDPPSYPIPLTGGKRLKAGVMALMLAAALGAGVPGLVEFFKRPVETEDDVEGVLGLPVLSSVPRVRWRAPMFLSVRSPKGFEKSRRGTEALMFSEAFRNLRVAIQLAMRSNGLRTILIASAHPDEGKSTILVNLGLAFGEAGKRVVLADTDFLRPTLHETLEIRQHGGLVDVLHAKQGLDQALAPVRERVWLAPRGATLHRDTRGMLATDRLRALLQELTEKADVVLCDSSPILLIPDNLFLASAVDGVVLVAQAGQTGVRDLSRAKSMLESAGAKILGVVINGMPPSQLKRYYKRYYAAYVKGETS